MKKISYYLFLLVITIYPRMVSGKSLVENTNDGSLLEFLTRIKNYLLVVTGSLAVLFLAIGGIQYITSGGNSQKIDTAKKSVTYAIYGLLFIIVANLILGLITGNFLGSIFGNDPARL